MRPIVLLAGLALVAVAAPPVGGARPFANPCAAAAAVPAALRLPAVVPPGEPVAIEARMLAYLRSREYRKLGWCVDKAVRDTGPYLNRMMYGTHAVVRIYYSPDMIDWLTNGRHGVPRDGAVMIKEQYGTRRPAEAYAGTRDADLQPSEWTLMIRRSSASHDGWFWAELYAGMPSVASPLGQKARTAYPSAGFGVYCLRCHASAQTASTFASLENVRGFPGEPIRYNVDESWRLPLPATPERAAAATLATRAQIAVSPIQTFVPEPLDAYAAPAGTAPPAFLTSSQCMGCHSAASGPPFGPVMWVTPGPRASAKDVAGIDVSEYGEWRWSPMALAGRDPVFYAQIASELAYVDGMANPHARASLRQPVVDTCTSCHGVMGKRAYAAEHSGKPYALAFAFDGNPSHAEFAYGGLARDGISCTVCHSIAETAVPSGSDRLAYFLKHSINGSFETTAPGRLGGPLKDDVIVTHAMKEALGIKPVYSRYVTTSRACGSCHTIDLPVIDDPSIKMRKSGTSGRSPEFAARHNVEQATYLEWLNSRYQTEYAGGKGARSCQDCHMPAGLNDPEHDVALTHVATRIALIQDNTYPQTTDAASHSDLNVRFRNTGYRRHELLGLNAFLLQTFKQFAEPLGVRIDDYMSGSKTSLDQAIHNVALQARRETARVRLSTRLDGRSLIADVEVLNLTGHRFPSGVAFRRAFVDFEVRDATAPAESPPVFASGRTDERGRIVDAEGHPLPSESFARDARERQQYQEHYDLRHPITRTDQAEIFEELVRDREGSFTTSFMRRDEEVKDNRLLPAGWTRAGRVAMPEYFLHATYPKGRAATDPAYLDGKGHAVIRYVVALPEGVAAARLRVTAAVYYQSWAPYYLAVRTSSSDAASRRLGRFVDGLDLAGTPLAGWRLYVASDSTITARAVSGASRPPARPLALRSVGTDKQ